MKLSPSEIGALSMLYAQLHLEIDEAPKTVPELVLNLKRMQRDALRKVLDACLEDADNRA